MHEQRLRNESGGQIFQTRRSQQVSDLILDHALNGQDEQALGRMEEVDGWRHDPRIGSWPKEEDESRNQKDVKLVKS